MINVINVIAPERSDVPRRAYAASSAAGDRLGGEGDDDGDNHVTTYHGVGPCLGAHGSSTRS